MKEKTRIILTFVEDEKTGSIETEVIQIDNFNSLDFVYFLFFCFFS